MSRNRSGLWQSRAAAMRLVLGTLTAATATAAAVFFSARPTAQSPGPCSPPNGNPIVCENQLPGNPESEWDVSGAGDSTIQGYATDISVTPGQTISFKIDTDARAYTIDIYRMGYYGGFGARKITSISPSVTLPQTQPQCLTDDPTGLIDCGNWAVSASWLVPSNAVSGIYFAKLTRSDTHGASHIVFIVRDDVGQSDVLFQTSDTTWQAYNEYGGHSLYVGGPGQNPGRAYKVSYNRPFTTRGTTPEDWVFNAEYPMVRWLEANGFNVSYTTGVDSDRRGAELREHKIFLSVGHDEYWSAQQRTNVEAARDAGLNLAFFSGNEVFWKTRWENSISSPATSYRTLVSYKETHANAKIDPLSNVWTGTWADPRFSPPADGGRPQNALTGTFFRVNCCTETITVPAADGKMRFWRNTAVAQLAPGATATLTNGTLGYEWDQDEDNGFRPAGLFRLSTTVASEGQYLLDYGSTYGAGTANHALTMYRAGSGALVFGAGTVQWSWGLDSNHDRGSAAANASMQQATVNLFADMGVQPLTLQSGLVAAAPSADNVAPTSTITSPSGGATVPQNTNVTISGTAVDAGGGVVGGVEISVDNGATWHPVNGRGAWTYTWATGGSHTAVIKTRAVDDSGNIEVAGPGISVTVGSGQATCPCSIWTSSQTPTNPAEADNTAVELGVKFRSSVAGYISGIKFYKGTTNTGTHIGNLWTASGTLLATATFTAETAAGWQQVDFATPVAINANTTYVASYHTDSGHYADDQGYFASTAYTNGPLTAVVDGGSDGHNGVYKEGGTGFPTSDFNASNYWVDVVFVTSASQNTTPPTVLSTTPSNGAVGVALNSAVTATFSKSINPSTLTSSTFELRNASNALVTATVTYNDSVHTATLTPSAALADSTTFTARVRGGSTGVQDTFGNALAADVTWSFTTQGPPPPPPTDGPGGPILVITSSSNPFSTYYAEILRAEGLNAFTTMDQSAVTASVLSSYDVVILGEMPLSSAQVTMFADWVTAGGNLIAMRPDKKLASLLGLTDANATLSDAYLLVNTAAAPGAGIVSQTMQFHGTADRYTLNGADSIATLYAGANVATTSPAVTMRSIGTSGGQAAAFSYDLARSVVYTRQGNPAWAGQERDGTAPRRSDDLFFGGSVPNYVDLNKVAIPQADEQQRLLANMIGFMNADRKPLPKFWYFPRGVKAVIVMTGDDHASGGTVSRFDQYLSMSSPGCSVDNWECIRGTSYMFPGTPVDDAQVAGYVSQGFEIALHLRASGPNTDAMGCNDFTRTSLNSDFSTQLSQFAGQYPSSGAPQTNRNHCIVWSDYDSMPQVELAHGIRLDTDYYYWPGWWINDVPGMFTGSGIPMRFTRTDGTMIDVYQAPSQMTDESDQTFPYNVDTLLDRAVGQEGYYGAFVANMHTDFDQKSIDGSNAIIASAKSHGVPVVSAKQMLTWLDGRNGSSFGNLAWNNGSLSFTVNLGAGSNGIQAMLPALQNGQSLTSLTRNGSPVSYTVQSIKGVWYAFFPAQPGSYVASYAVDTTPPAITNLSATAGAISATVSWTTNEIATSRVDYGRSPTTLFSTAASSALSTAHSVQLTSLSAGTTYYYRVTSVDASGNVGTAPVAPATGTFTTGTGSTSNCPCTIFPSTSVPAVQSENDEGDVEVGVKFTASVDGYVTGIRFYKGSLNVGTHIGNLWTSTGTLLGTVTFSNETASGWQQASLVTPVQIKANTTYVVSYHTGGFYSDNGSYFTSAVTNGPLTALASSASGGNGVYKYGPTGFPSETFSAANYWVDLVFVTSLPPDTTPPVVTGARPFPNLSNMPLTTPIAATFSESMNSYSFTSTSFELRDGANQVVPATIGYDSITRTATLQPVNPLAPSTTYTARVVSGAPGVKDFSGNPLAADYVWSFTTAPPPPPPPTSAPGGPVLVVTTPANPFSTYYAEILRAEGLNAFALKDLSAVTSVDLANYDVVILGEMPLTAAQVTMFSDWVNAGGNLIAMRPDKKLASLLGLTDAGTTLADAYMQVNTAAAPGSGIVSQTMQFHGTADAYTLNGATSVATLFSTASASTSNPAVTVRSVGSAGGQAAAFTYDLARSVVYTRQGNPAWNGQERDGLFPIRSDDLFFGGSQPNYVDLTKVAIPQADEQQRLLANVIEFLNVDRKPLPKFWYFPRGLKAVVVMTGDDHGNNGTAGRFDIYNAGSAPGCSVDDWECIRSTSYIFPSTPITPEQAAAYVAQGFEIAVHMRATGPATDPLVCNDYTQSSLDIDYSNQMATFASLFPTLPPALTNRTHCIVWSDYDSQPQVEYGHGIRLDTTYYYWPDTWVNNVPGMFTGSGIPMRFTKLDGTMIDVYQAASQMTDESGQGYPFTANTLFDRALGAEGYYGAFVANMHTDKAVHDGSAAIVSSAQARGIPIISAKQLLTWLDGRNNSAFVNLTWTGQSLTFSMSLADGSRGMQAMLPTTGPSGTLTGITRDGVPVAYTVQTLKGMSYALFPAAAGNFVAEYGVDTVAPLISDVNAVSDWSTAAITWTTNEATTTRVDYGTTPTSLTQSVTVAGLSTGHSVPLSGLSPVTTYYFRVTSADAAGNSASAPTSAASFTTKAAPPIAVTDATVADFTAGTPGTGIYLGQTADGEVMLAPAIGQEFNGTALPAGWSAANWVSGGSSTVGGGVLTVDGARTSMDATLPVGQRLEFGATFPIGPFVHVGFGLTLNETPWIIFSTMNGDGLYARTHDGTTAIDTPLPGNWLGAPHRFRIDWTATGIQFYIDGALVASRPTIITTALRPIISDLNAGGTNVKIDWIRLSPYAASGTFTSRVIDAGVATNWSSVLWNAAVPSGTGLAISARFGNTAVPDGTWTPFTAVPSSGSAISQTSRYVQYQATLTGDGTDTPALQDITFSAAPPPPAISIANASVTEGNSGTSNATFVVSLSAASPATVSVSYATADGSATAGTDYTSTAGTLTFTPGVTSQTVVVPVAGDTTYEGNETFQVTLSSPVNGTLGTAQATGTIVNDDAQPALTIAGASVTEGNSGSSNAAFTVTLSAASSQTVTVNYATANGTAASGTDYTAATGTVTFAPGTTSQTINVPVLGDVIDEPNETFTVTLSGATNATIATGAATGTIVDDDAAPSLAINSVSVTEGNTGSVTATFTVTMTGASSQTVSVNYATANGTAAAGSDYTSTSGTLTFAPGTTTRTLTVAVLGDTIDEANETFAVNLSGAVNATIGTAAGTGTILDNDPSPALSINSVSVTEGNTGTVNATFTVTLTGSTAQTVTVNYATANGTATAGSDYTATSGTLTFTPGTTTRTVTVAVLGDTRDEDNETFTVGLSGATNATVTTATGTGTILDNDATPSLVINNVSVTEGNSGTKLATFTVTLSAASGRTVTVNYATANGTATAGTDYNATSGTLTFAAGTTTQTISVTIRGDVTREGNETFAVNLSGATNATIADSQGVGTILNDN